MASEHDCDRDGDVARSIERNAAEGVQNFHLADGTGGTALPIDQQIAADRHLAARRAARSPLGGVRLTQIIPGPSL